MSSPLAQFAKWEEAIEFRLGRHQLVAFRAMVTILFNVVLCLLMFAFIKVLEIAMDHYIGVSTLFGVIPLSYLFAAADVAILLVYGISTVSTLFDVLRRSEMKHDLR
jgi:hypothetical protein